MKVKTIGNFGAPKFRYSNIEALRTDNKIHSDK